MILGEIFFKTLLFLILKISKNFLNVIIKYAIIHKNSIIFVKVEKSDSKEKLYYKKT